MAAIRQIDSREEIGELVKNPSIQEVQLLCKSLYDKWLSTGQAEIVQAIVFGDKRVAILAPTRYGKTVAIGVATALYLTINPGRSVTIMANKDDTCANIRSEFINAAANYSPLLKKLEGKSTDAKSLSEELSKDKIELSDGTKVILQAAGTNVSPDALDGIGGDLNILDESDNVPDENFTQGIRRMLGESEQAKMVQTGNATLRNKHFHNAWKNDKYQTVKITWRQAVNERYGPDGDRPLTRDFVLGEKQQLPPSHFKAMYECRFPEEDEGSLISYKWIKKAEKESLPENEKVEDPLILYGYDPAREGRDTAVLTRVEKHGPYYVVTGQEALDIPDIQRQTEQVMEIIGKKDGQNYTRINVDTHGMGSGALDILRRNNFYATGVKVGISKNSALKRPDDFVNLKSEFYDKVRSIIQDGDMFFEGDFPQLSNQLDDLQIQESTRNKISVVDPSKSPDYADSLMLALSVDKPRKQGEIGSTKAF